jgi:hypothetical protein
MCVGGWQLTNFTKGLFLYSYLGGTKSVHEKKGHKIICYVSFRPHCKKETKRAKRERKICIETNWH